MYKKNHFCIFIYIYVYTYTIVEKPRTTLLLLSEKTWKTEMFCPRPECGLYISSIKHHYYCYYYYFVLLFPRDFKKKHIYVEVNLCIFIVWLWFCIWRARFYVGGVSSAKKIFYSDVQLWKPNTVSAATFNLQRSNKAKWNFVAAAKWVSTHALIGDLGWKKEQAYTQKSIVWSLELKINWYRSIKIVQG